MRIRPIARVDFTCYILPAVLYGVVSCQTLLSRSEGCRGCWPPCFRSTNSPGWWCVVQRLLSDKRFLAGIGCDQFHVLQAPSCALACSGCTEAHQKRRSASFSSRSGPRIVLWMCWLDGSGCRGEKRTDMGMDLDVNHRSHYQKHPRHTESTHT